MNKLSLAPLLGTRYDLDLAASFVRNAILSIQRKQPVGEKMEVGMLEHAADIIEFRREIADEIETVINDANKANESHTKKDGYEIALDWYADLDLRLQKSNGYYVDSKLREVFENTPMDQRDTFLDSIGVYITVFKTSGVPSSTFLVDSEEISLHKMSPADQDAHAEAREADNG